MSATRCRCFRNLLLLTRQQLLPAKAFAPDLELTLIDEVIFLGNLLLTKLYTKPGQQLMTEVPSTTFGDSETISLRSTRLKVHQIKREACSTWPAANLIMPIQAESPII